MREELEPQLLRLQAPNPGPLTGPGTNTYIVGRGPFVVIDPGPDDEAHLAAILAATGGEIEAILVTHSHLDHTALLPRLKAATGAPVYAFGPSGAGQSDVMARLAAEGRLGGTEGADPDFAPDRRLGDEDTVELAGERFTAVHTPGHFGNHLSLSWRGSMFSGDHVMGWATTLVSPPHGDLTDFMASCRRLATLDHQRFFPGHGDPVPDPAARLSDLIAHRTAREDQIRAGLNHGPATARALTEAIYTDVPQTLWPAAERNVLAHLIDLTTRGYARPEGLLTHSATFRLVK